MTLIASNTSSCREKLPKTAAKFLYVSRWDDFTTKMPSWVALKTGSVPSAVS
jgi:hypothetical protein